MAQLQLFPDNSKRLEDYPRITDVYRKMDSQYLPVFLSDMRRRATVSKGEWDIKFAALHVQAIEAEIKKRKENTEQAGNF